MDNDVRDFIASATLLFIASRSPDGTLDVSPRGGQPFVLWPDAEGRLLLPDYLGNRRLDTIGNLLDDPRVVVALLSRGSNRFLRIRAQARLSTGEDDIAIFPADQNRPMAAIVLTPSSFEFVESDAFARAGFWLDPSERKPPLDMLGYYRSDKDMHRDAGRLPVRKSQTEEARLIETGLRTLYGTPSEVVQTKVYDAVGSGGLAFIAEASFIILATEALDGELQIDVLGGETLSPNPAANRQAFRLVLSPNMHNVPTSGESALVAAVPGRCEALRLNGKFRSLGSRADESPVIDITPDEIFFHCSAALTRSRIWAEPRSTAWNGLRRFVLTDIRQENAEVRSFALQPRDLAPVGEILPGQYVTICLPQDGSQERRRNYSVSGRPAERAIRITVKKAGEQGLSSLLHSLHVGDEVYVGVPAGRFVFESAPGRPVVLVGAGVGITPLIPMLQAIVNECAERDVWFVQAARNPNYHLFLDEVRDLADQSAGRVRIVTVYSRANDDDICDHRGRVDAGLLAELVPVSQADFYLCGPADFMRSLRQDLVVLGAKPDSIRFEEFTSSGASLPDKLAGRPDCTVTFAHSRKEVTWHASSGSLLDLALANDIKVSYSCRNGDCQSCIQKLASGHVDYPVGELPVLSEGQVLLCQAVPRTDTVILC